MYYAIIDHCEDSRYNAPEQAKNWVIHDDEKMDYAAEECVSDYHKNHDGADSTFPLTVALFRHETGEEIGRFIVNREYEPVFSALKIEQQPLSEKVK